MINQVKWYLIGGVILLFILSIVGCNYYYKKYKTEKATTVRLWNNNQQLLTENLQNTNLILTKDEFVRVISDSLKGVLKRLEIKPKQVLKIEEKKIFLHDTIPKEVPVYVIKRNQWLINDSSKCWQYKAKVRFEEDTVKINRLLFDYHNKTTDIFSKKLKFKFLFIRFYSRTEFVQNSISECGESTSKTITVMK